MKTELGLCLLAAGMCLAPAAARAAEPAKPAAKAAAAAGVVWTADDLKWKDSATVKGASMAVLSGDPAKGAYSAIKKVAAGTDLGLHWHTREEKVVMISGQIEFSFEGGPVKTMGPTSYTVIPGGMKHSSKCASTTDCVYFSQQPGAADFKTAAPAAAAK